MGSVIRIARQGNMALFNVLNVFNQSCTIYVRRTLASVKGYRDIHGDGLSRFSPPRKKKESPTGAKSRFWNGMEKLTGCLIGELIPYSGEEAEPV